MFRPEIQDRLSDPTKFPDDCHLDDDSPYKLHDNLIVPYRDGHLTERQKNYNFCHSSARISIERVIGLLKNRFRSLLQCFPMNKIDLIARFNCTLPVVSCIIFV